MCVLPPMQDRTANKGKKVDELKKKRKTKGRERGEGRRQSVGPFISELLKRFIRQQNSKKRIERALFFPPSSS